MNKILKYVLILSGLFCLVTLVISLFGIDKFYTSVVGFIGLNGLYLGIASNHITRANSARILGGYILVYMFIFFWINYDLYLYFLFRDHMKFTDLFILNPEGLYFYHNLLRTILMVLLTIYGIWQIIKGGRVFCIYRKLPFKMSIFLLLLYFLGELPVYDLHGDFGGNLHGHSFWNGLHMH